jgi:hypothetical protein
MGRLELPLPEMGRSLETHAKDLQERIREHIPEKLRMTVVVKTFKKGDRTGIAIEYDDKVENLVYAAIEYPRK